MKFAFAILSVLALAMGVQSSVVPWVPQVVGGGLSYTAVSSPWAHWGAPWGAWSPWAHGVAVAAPVVAAQGTYVAQTRGAVHTAPLEGHVQSVANVNLAPAPGTI